MGCKRYLVWLATGNISVMSSPSGFRRSWIRVAQANLISGSIAQKNLQHSPWDVSKTKWYFRHYKWTWIILDLRIVKYKIKQLRWMPGEEVRLYKGVIISIWWWGRQLSWCSEIQKTFPMKALDRWIIYTETYVALV